MTLQNVKISLKTDDLSNWTSFNPVLNDGELAIVNDISANLTKFKVGNGLSTFTQLPYVDDKIVTNYLQANDVQAHHFSQGVHAESSPLGLAAGYFLSAAANFSQVMGVNAQAAAGTDYSFVWNGNDIEALGQYYSAHGKGSFNINPLSGISGVYVGEQTLADIIDSNVSSKQDALDDAQMSAVNSGITSGKVQKYDGYEAAIQQKIELSDIPRDLSAFTNSPGYVASADISSKIEEITNKVIVDGSQVETLSVTHISQDDFYQRVIASTLLSNEIYVVSSDYINAYGEQLKNLADPTDLSDAATKGYVDNALSNVQIPTDLSSFTNSPGYLVSNDISGYYQKSETSSASEISSALAEIASLSGIQQIVWANLVNLAQTSALVPGMKYRITDYVATVANQSDARSAAASGLSVGFDIIVTADSTSKLNEKASAIRHAGNTYYPNTTKFEAWQVLYCLDNDTTRFAWADTTNGKGVVYRLIDEFNNDVPYDFKGIQFKAYGDTDNVWRWTFDNGAASNNLDSSKDGSSFNNNISKYKLASGYKNYVLNRNIFKGGCHCNRLDYNCHDNTFGDNCNYNVLGSGCYNNISDSDSGNMFGIECHDNTLGYQTYSNVLNDRCNNISIGDECCQNTFQENCSNIVFGNECNGMVFGNNCNNIKFGSSSSVTSATAKSYCRYINIASGNQYIVLNITGTTSDSSYYQNIDIKPGVNNTSTYKTITDSNVNQNFCTTYQPANSQVIAV